MVLVYLMAIYCRMSQLRHSENTDTIPEMCPDCYRLEPLNRLKKQNKTTQKSFHCYKNGEKAKENTVDGGWIMMWHLQRHKGSEEQELPSFLSRKRRDRATNASCQREHCMERLWAEPRPCSAGSDPMNDSKQLL